jgi:hypothetical protein
MEANKSRLNLSELKISITLIVVIVAAITHFLMAGIPYAYF